MKPKLRFLKYIFFIPLFIPTSSIFENNSKEFSEKYSNKTTKIQIEPGKEIVFGQSIYKSGAFKLYGKIIQHAILAYFNKINEKGGIKGKKLKLVGMDDKGMPALAEKNINQMLKQNIDMFLGNMGTRSVLKVLPLIKSGKIAMFFPWGGDKKLRNPELTNIINGPGLIKPQIEALVSYIINTLKLTKIAIFHADSSFSIANAQETINILKKYGITSIKTASFNRFTMDINTPADKLIKADPKVVITLCTNKPAIKLISRFFEKGHYGTSFLGIDSTLFVGKILQAKGAKFHYASAVPDPHNTKIPLVQEYQKDLKKFFPKESFNILSLTYYISAKIIVKALEQIKGTITKEKIIEQIEKMQNFDLDGFVINFDPAIRHAYGQNISIIKG